MDYELLSIAELEDVVRRSRDELAQIPDTKAQLAENLAKAQELIAVTGESVALYEQLGDSGSARLFDANKAHQSAVKSKQTYTRMLDEARSRESNLLLVVRGASAALERKRRAWRQKIASGVDKDLAGEYQRIKSAAVEALALYMNAEAARQTVDVQAFDLQRLIAQGLSDCRQVEDRALQIREDLFAREERKQLEETVE